MHLPNYLTDPDVLRHGQKVLSDHSCRSVFAHIRCVLFFLPSTVAVYPFFAANDQVHCVASPKGAGSLSVSESLVLTEEVEAVMGGREEAGAHSGGGGAWAAGSRERGELRIRAQAWHPEAQVRQLWTHFHAVAGAAAECRGVRQEMEVEALLHQQIHHQGIETEMQHANRSAHSE